MDEPQHENNLGTRRLVQLPPARFPTADPIVTARAIERSHQSKVDVLLVNPPSPDGGIWIRTQHRVGRRSRENMIWPQVSLAQLASLLAPDYTVEVIDAIAMRMTWPEFEKILQDRRPHYYLTQVTAPTLTNDMYGVFLAKSLDAVTLAFGTHVTPMAGETLRTFPNLDYVLRGEPELTLRELVDTYEVTRGRWKVTGEGRLVGNQSGQEPKRHPLMWKMWQDSDPDWRPAWINTGSASMNDVLPTPTNLQTPDLSTGSLILSIPPSNQLARIKGLGWRNGSQILINPDRPFICNLDDLPIPYHQLLPNDRYLAPLIKGPYTFIVTSRGCPAGCKFCIKHVSYQYSVRLRSPELLVEEMWLLKDLGVRHIQMYSDLFTVNRDQVVNLCKLMIKEGLKLTWTCNSRVDYVDEEMLQLMGRAGCQLISWGIESGNEAVLKTAHKGYKMEQAPTALKWAHAAGIKNWGYFIIGLPGETVESIQQTIALSKKLPIDIALFHVAAPYPGTPFFFEAVENGWFRKGVDWESLDMDQATVLDYPGLKAEDLLYWQKRAFREWALRPAPLLFYLRSMNTWEGFKSALNIGLQTLGWMK
jgi:anaerobic magnesium-protoporphyrin IX monomethyl ester cyclase